MSRPEHTDETRRSENRAPERGDRADEQPEPAADASGHESSERGGAGTAPGVRHDPVLQSVDRLARLGNEEEKPADDRFGE